MDRRIFAGLMALALFAPGGAWASQTCPVPPGAAAVAGGLDRTRADLVNRRAFTIVALGSSSTEGVGASGPAATYPAQLQAILGERTRTGGVRVLNKGVGGETAADNLARLHDDVIARAPDLVVWQVGTNDAFRKVPLDRFRAAVRQGVEEIRAVGAELILMNPQFYPGETKVADYGAYVAAVNELGLSLGIPVLDRHRTMQSWIATGHFQVAEVLSTDGLHLRDASYRCLAEMLADMMLTPEPRRETASVPAR